MRNELSTNRAKLSKKDGSKRGNQGKRIQSSINIVVRLKKQMLQNLLEHFSGSKWNIVGNQI